MRMGGADMAIELSDEDIASDDIVEEDIERMDQRYAATPPMCLLVVGHIDWMHAVVNVFEW